MRILFIYRNPKMGFSIGKVFKPIEEEMRKYCDVESIELPYYDYAPKSIWRNIRFMRSALKATKYDAVLITGTENYLLPFVSSARKIAVVHDVMSFYYKMNGWKLKLKELMFIKVLCYADSLVAISERTQEELKQVGYNSQVIYDPVAPEFQYVPHTMNKECPVILHVGTKENKNLGNSILALKGIRCHLRIVGPLSDDTLKQLQVNGIDYTSCANISDEELLQEYRNCDIVNFPSFYEGFGMPIIEGQATGRVVVTSNLSPMKDVAGGAAVLVDPHDVESIRKGYLEAIDHSADYIAKGIENAKRFSAKTITEQYYNLINSTLK